MMDDSKTDKFSFKKIYNSFFKKTEKLKKEAESSIRDVYLNYPVPDEKQEDIARCYCTNRISTSQYTLFSFVPVNVYRQFKRAANMYFLIMTIVQIIPYFAIGSPILALLPLLSVLVITGFKDGLEDWRRHVNDRSINDRTVNVVKNLTNVNLSHEYQKQKQQRGYFRRLLRKKSKEIGVPNTWLTEEFNTITGVPKEERINWSDVRVGDVIKLYASDPVPADILVLSSSSEDGSCFADSKDLDGETNLKPKMALEPTSKCTSINELENVRLHVQSDSPTENMLVFNSKITVYENGEENIYSTGIKNMLLRGMVIKNTDWVIGLVIYTGKQTKVIMNAGPPPFKRSRLERMMNKQVIANFGLLAVVCITFSVTGGLMYHIYDRKRGDLLFVDGSTPSLIYSIRLFVSTLVLLQNVIPISLYVSIEFIKLMHAYFIFNDLKMYYEAKGIRCIPRNWSISDDMGQVSYVFSDKTGTLTRNIMDFRMCSINGLVYGKQLPGDELDVVKGRAAQEQVDSRNIDEDFTGDQESTAFGTKYSRKTMECETEDGSQDDIIIRRRNAVTEYLSAMKKVFDPKYVDLGDQDIGETGAYTFVDPEIFKHMKPEVAENINKANYAPWTSEQEQKESIDLFLTHLAVCHTVLVERNKQPGSSDYEESTKSKKNNGTPSISLLKSLRRGTDITSSTKRSADQDKQPPNKVFSRHESQASTMFDAQSGGSPRPLKYSAESPDESSLVSAAQNLGYAFLGRTRNTLTLDVLGKQVQYQILNTIEFNSTRKRMSVVVKRPAPYNDIAIFTKGADSIILNLLRELDVSETKEINKREATFRQIDEFANAGLRTLVLGYRVIDENEYKKWASDYLKATSCLSEDRDKILERVCADIERDLELVGSTGIEDKLQENVPDCIASLRSAGIKIWVLTGDKMETAINIGFASNLLTKDMELWTLDGKKSKKETLDQFWLISKMARESAKNDLDFTLKSQPKRSYLSLLGFGEPSLGEDIYSMTPGNNDQKADLDAINARRISLRRYEQSLLGRISYRLKRAKKYVMTMSKLKRTKPTSMGEDEIIQESINMVRSDVNKRPMQEFSTEAGRRFSRAFEYIDMKKESSGLTSALVIDGVALATLLETPDVAKELCDLAPLFKSVICCRSSPLQKSQVVNLVRSGMNTVTLAIGDGANDVSMIQAADIGVAISGEEGLQAANASDYTIGRFHFLQNLLLVHGLFNYLRISESILSFFYKNAVWAIAPVWFAFFCRFSGNMFYEYMYIQLYNLVFTVFPVLVLGCIDKPFNYRTAMIYTATYKAGIKNSYFSNRRFLFYMLDGFYQSAVCFFIFYAFVAPNATVQSASGRVWSIFDFSSGIVGALVICASLTLGINAWSWSWIMWGSIAFSIGSFFLFNFIITFVPGSNLYQSFKTQFWTMTFWFAMSLSVVLALTPRFVYKYYQRNVKPTDIDVVREIKILHRPWYGEVQLENK
ncbi:hypothetical protein BB558_000672 [Smittium angustum]|uniref:Phospholipid-transporting ATPase n=1 Tax=Smittium angustum TaxID=133377 RepID=A0A2U1JDH5_SMIAN|nr:hypothetical protein BB558_000672 [Smittium angustum]